jgi:DNA-binding NtrC family response regulator
MHALETPDEPDRSADPSADPDWTGLNLHGQSPAFRSALALLHQCARVDATVLVCGETGTGKELAARAIHYLSPRRHGPFVPINCGALPDSILEAELFGHTRGAFTDAKTDSLGVIGQAQGGTLFLDEIDALSPRAQAAILRFAQDRSYRPLGSPQIKQADVRIVAATNADLSTLAEQGRFRQDLLYRLNVLSVPLPPLRERQDDTLLLARAFVQRLVRQYGTPPRSLSPGSAAWLQQPRTWQGNVRELEHLIHRAFLLCAGTQVELQAGTTQPSVLAATPINDPAALDGMRLGRTCDAPALAAFAEAKAEAIEAFERRYLTAVLNQAGGNLSLAARLAGKERSRFCRLVRKHGLQRGELANNDLDHAN